MSQVTVSMEKLLWHGQRDMHWLKKAIVRSLEMVLDVRTLTFDRGDVNFKVVEEMVLNHSEHLRIIGEWIGHPNYDFGAKLWEAQRALLPYLNGWKHPSFYRGFDTGSGQSHMGLKFARGWFGPKPHELKVGDKFSYVADHPLSFSHVQGIAESFGKIIVKVSGRKQYHRMLPLTPTLVYAVDRLLWDNSDIFKNDDSWVTEAETILLPSKEPIEFEVVSVGKR